jgi:hypothetical protein
MQKVLAFLLLLTSIGSLIGGCAHDAGRLDRLAVDALEQRCERAQISLELKPELPEAGPPLAGPPFTPATWLLADALGIQSDLLTLSALTGTADKSVETRLAYAEKRQRVLQRLLLVSFQISGTVAELDCEASRAQHLATSLEEARDKKIRTLTLIAIIGDALVGILAGGLSLAGEETAAAAAAISGGTIATTFGVAAIYGKTYHDFSHPRNLLTAIWQPSSVAAAYPSAIWRYLNSSLDLGQPTPREVLVSHWRREGLIEKPEEALLYFGGGGRYEIDDLRTRIVMLDMVKAEVNRMNQQLSVMLQEMASLSSE